MPNRSTSHQRHQWLIAVLLLAATVSASAQTTTPQTQQTKAAAAATTPAPARDQAAKPASPQTVSSGQAIYLVRSTLMMLNDANRSGNYTVMRDLGAPEFQSRNSAADLAQSFFELRRRKFDLFAVTLLAPKFSTDPAVDSSGKMRLTGFFPTRPQQIAFDLLFQAVNGQWKLLAISVATPEAPKEQSSLSPPPASSHSGKGPFYGLHRVPQGTVPTGFGHALLPRSGRNKQGTGNYFAPQSPARMSGMTEVSRL
jgi:hypothetical protein